MNPGSPPPTAGSSSAALATSSHPVPAHAVAECAGQLIDLGGPLPTDVLVAVPPSSAGALEDIVSALGSLLGARRAAGVVTSQVWAGAGGGSATAVLSLAATRPALVPLGGPSGRGTPDHQHGGILLGVGGSPRGLVPRDFVPGDFVPGDFAGVAAELSPAASHRRLRVHLDGVAVQAEALLVVPPGDGSDPLPSHGVVKVGAAMTVTGTDGDEVSHLDSRPAADAFEAALAGTTALPSDADLVGFVDSPGSPLIAARRSAQGLALSERVHVGTELFPAVRSPSALVAEVVEAAGAGAPDRSRDQVTLLFGDEASGPPALSAGAARSLAGLPWMGLQVRGLRVIGSATKRPRARPAAAVTLRIPGS